MESIPNEYSGTQNNFKPPTALLPKCIGEEGEYLEKIFNDFESRKCKYSLFGKKLNFRKRAIIISSLERRKLAYEKAKDLSQALASPLQQENLKTSTFKNVVF